MNKYIVSNNGLGIAVGVTGSTAQEDATLAENIYGCNTSDHLFGSLIYLSSVNQFRKFLILKEYYKVWDAHWAANKEYNNHLPTPPNVYKFTKQAIKQAKQIINSNVQYENFMSKISARNNEYQVGNYQDDLCESQ
jgi:hypothetical protein